MLELQTSASEGGRTVRRRHTARRGAIAVAVFAIVATACGGDSDSADDTLAVTTVTLAGPVTTDPPATTVAAAETATTAAPTAGTTPSSEACPTYTENLELPLKICDSGTKVTEAQTGLVAAGHEITVDGFFGQQTANAVLEFQANNGLEVDGVVGELTWAALFPEE